MKTIRVLKLPPCDICGRDARYDAPTIGGPWANVCRSCAMVYTYVTAGGMGSEYQLVEERSL